MTIFTQKNNQRSKQLFKSDNSKMSEEVDELYTALTFE